MAALPYASLRGRAPESALLEFAKANILKPIMKERVILSDPEVMSGVPCFRGTRVPFKNLIDFLEHGHPLSEFLRQFPSVSHEMAIQALEEAKDSLFAQIA